MNNKFLLTLFLSSVMLWGTGCTHSTSNDGSIAFAQLGFSIFDSRIGHAAEGAEEFSTFSFVDGKGSCVDMGLENFSYVFDSALDYYVVQTNDGLYRDEYAALFSDGELDFEDFPLTNGPVKECQIFTKTGKNEAEATCIDEDINEVCTAVYNIKVLK